MIAVRILRRPRRDVGMGMINAQHLQPALIRFFLDFQVDQRINEIAVTSAVRTLVISRHNFRDDTFFAEHHATALVRIPRFEVRWICEAACRFSSLSPRIFRSGNAYRRRGKWRQAALLDCRGNLQRGANARARADAHVKSFFAASGAWPFSVRLRSRHRWFVGTWGSYKSGTCEAVSMCLRPSSPWNGPSGWMATSLTSRLNSRSRFPCPSSCRSCRARRGNG